MPRSYAHSTDPQYKRRQHEYKLLRENMQNYKRQLSKMTSKKEPDENYMVFLNTKIRRIERQLYQEIE